ncbi:hypothetical protein chiPu_0003345 [Chiloscyllium punctatum]|uniref:Uncharacterized protein n=1 Tax=Chiloscyllium punctatum TaxID=137246 RepID=A0A401S3J4_CHIPU|nr:hypothetical protein [Chiloscyllium punctatum]
MLRRGSTSGRGWSRASSNQTKRLKADVGMAATLDEKTVRASSESATYYHAVYQLQGQEDNRNSCPSYSSEDDCDIRCYAPVSQELEAGGQAARKRNNSEQHNSIIRTHEMYKHDLPLNSYQQSFLQHKSLHQPSEGRMDKDYRFKQNNLTPR